MDTITSYNQLVQIELCADQNTVRPASAFIALFEDRESVGRIIRESAVHLIPSQQYKVDLQQAPIIFGHELIARISRTWCYSKLGV